MDLITAKSLSEKLQISLDYIVREEYEMLFLKNIFESEFGTSLVFKGGTALRLAYGSPRFSEDLDFTLVSKINYKKFTEFLNKTGKRYPNITSVEAIDKFYTIFTLIRVKDPILKRAFSIKVEISKRGSLPAKKQVLKVLKSETTPFTALANVANLELILWEKTDALKNRKTARDVFDYWFINQLLHKEVKPNFSGYDKSEALAELHKLLPKSYWRGIDIWFE